MKYSEEQIVRANAVDLMSFLTARGERFKKSGREYRWTTHDSVTVKDNQWFRHSQGKGGGPIDFLMEFYDKTFTEAVAELLEERGMETMDNAAIGVKDEGCLNDSPIPTPAMILPERNTDNEKVIQYLTGIRKIDRAIIDEFIRRGDIYEEAKTHRVVFTGRTPDGTIGYASWRGASEKQERGDIAGSSKWYGFKSLASWTEGTSNKERNSRNLYVFEAPIDLLSFLTLYPKYRHENHYLSLGGVSSAALHMFLSERKNVKHIYLCLDHDEAGHNACARIFDEIPEKYAVTQLIPIKKDWNEVLVAREDNPDMEYLADTIELRKEKEALVPVTKMSEIKETVVEWLWYPFIPYSKVTLIQGDPGEGKTWLAMALAAACTNRKPLPNEFPKEPFNVFYQSAEDGIGDTIKPRLKACGADLERVRVINEEEQPLSMTDPRLEQAIIQNNVKLVIMDPIQAYVGANVDMNRANEIRPLFRYLHGIAERTGSAMVLIGHLNKNAGTQATYRGLGSVDISAAVRSILHVGKVKQEEEKDIRVVIQTKSSLAPKPTPVAYTLEHGFVEWIGEYEITVEELMVGKSGKQQETKMDQGVDLIRELLNQRKKMYVSDLDASGTKYKISERTMRTARKMLEDELEYGYEGAKKTVHLRT